ncbi:transcriptional regulator, LysR family protein [Marinomonas sp. MED121]|uniref:LysR family transcriptional regulator n=1 Tax=Marinomonas sp. MED121 TaxID=314277 RepID=UPI00006903D8|nr:LysR family transcriptional regulator [Marinomonas sp. MED121]EAQ66173.1 transcriptional regulator, LysR family protein [Marinomonas sp. MED121]
MSIIEVRHLKTLTALRETGSLVEAAERVHLTQSALSHQLKDLEEKLGCPLFIRKTKPVRFTSSGLRLLQLADDVLLSFRAAQRDIQRFAEGESGRLHIAIECHSCYEWLMPTIDHFREHWPDVELDLSNAFSFMPLPALARGDLDLVVTSDPTDLPNIDYIPLFQYESQVALSRHHPLAKKEFFEPEDFIDETLISYPVETERLDVFKHFLAPAGLSPKKVRHSELTLMMMQLIASGRGICCLPNWALTEYTNRQYVITKSLGEEGVWCKLYLAVRKDQRHNAYMEDLINTARNTCFKNLKGILSADL